MIKHIKNILREPSVKLFDLDSIKLFLQFSSETTQTALNKHCFVLAYLGNLLASSSSSYEEEIEEYYEAALSLRSNTAFSFGEIYNNTTNTNHHRGSLLLKKIQNLYKESNFFENINTPPALSIRCSMKRSNNGKATTFSSSLMLDSFYGGTRVSLDKWIVAHSLQLVGDMNPNNFQTYEDLGLPMLLTFLDYNTKKKSMRKKNRKMIKILNASQLYKQLMKMKQVYF